MQQPTIAQIAETILGEIPGKQAHIDEIVECAISSNRNLGMNADDFRLKLMSALASAVKKKDATLAKVVGKNGNPKKGPFKKGYYRVKRVVSGPSDQLPLPMPVDRSFLGKAGEYAVMSELLFYGFNVSLMAVDKGIDIVAESGGIYFHLQVKTATEQDGAWRFSIKTSSFDANHKGNTYYVFVLRAAASNMYIVLPSTHIDTQRKLGRIKGDDALSISISSPDKGKTWMLNRQDNVTPFRGAFWQIK